MPWQTAEWDFYKSLMLYAYSKASLPEDAEEAASAAYTACKVSGRFHFALGAKVIRDELHDARERRKRMTCFGPREDDLPMGWLEADNRSGFRAELYDHMRDVICKSDLPKNVEQVLLYRLDGWDRGEIAGKLRTSVPTVSRLLARGIKLVALRDPYTGRWFTECSKHTTKGEPPQSVTQLAGRRLWLNPKSM